MARGVVVVPVRTADARPNPKYFARKRGVTWLNMISDQAVGLAGKVISGTPKDTRARRRVGSRYLPYSRQH